jgi:uncharacterized protein (TIGR02271 family)
MEKNTDFSNAIQENDASKFAQVIPVIEEFIKVEKKEIESGRIQIKKKINEEEKIISIPLVHNEFNVERIQMERPIDTAPSPIIYEGDTIIIPVVREEVMVKKQLVLMEEIRITKRKVETLHKQTVTLRKEEVVIERKEETEVEPTK